MALESTRRSFIGGLFAAPAVVRFSSLMPIYSRGFIALGYNAMIDGYDVIFPSGIIKSEQEVWPKLWKNRIPSYFSPYGTDIWNKRLEYPVLTGAEKRAAYAEALGFRPKDIELRYNVKEFETVRLQIEKQTDTFINFDLRHNTRFARKASWPAPYRVVV